MRFLKLKKPVIQILGVGAISLATLSVFASEAEAAPATEQQRMARQAYESLGFMLQDENSEVFVDDGTPFWKANRHSLDNPTSASWKDLGTNITSTQSIDKENKELLVRIKRYCYRNKDFDQKENCKNISSFTNAAINFQLDKISKIQWVEGKNASADSPVKQRWNEKVAEYKTDLNGDAKNFPYSDAGFSARDRAIAFIRNADQELTKIIATTADATVAPAPAASVAVEPAKPAEAAPGRTTDKTKDGNKKAEEESKKEKKQAATAPAPAPAAPAPAPDGAAAPAASATTVAVVDPDYAPIVAERNNASEIVANESGLPAVWSAVAVTANIPTNTAPGPTASSAPAATAPGIATTGSPLQEPLLPAQRRGSSPGSSRSGSGGSGSAQRSTPDTDASTSKICAVLIGMEGLSQDFLQSKGCTGDSEIEKKIRDARERLVKDGITGQQLTELLIAVRADLVNSQKTPPPAGAAAAPAAEGQQTEPCGDITVKSEIYGCVFDQSGFPAEAAKLQDLWSQLVYAQDAQPVPSRLKGDTELSKYVFGQANGQQRELAERLLRSALLMNLSYAADQVTEKSLINSNDRNRCMVGFGPGEQAWDPGVSSSNSGREEESFGLGTEMLFPGYYGNSDYYGDSFLGKAADAIGSTSRDGNQSDFVKYLNQKLNEAGVPDGRATFKLLTGDAAQKAFTQNFQNVLPQEFDEDESLLIQLDVNGGANARLAEAGASDGSTLYIRINRQPNRGHLVVDKNGNMTSSTEESAGDDVPLVQCAAQGQVKKQATQADRKLASTSRAVISHPVLTNTAGTRTRSHGPTAPANNAK